MPNTLTGAPAAPPDRAPVLAAFLLSEEGRACRDPDAIRGAIVSRWPDLSAGEFERGFQIAQEMLRADGAEHLAEADALDREYERRFGTVPD